LDNKPDIEVEAAADPRWLRPLRGLVRGYLENCGMSADEVDNSVLAVDEACTNILRHAYGGDPARRFRFSLRDSGAAVEIVLEDDGAPVPLERVRPERAAPRRETVEPGGRGVQILYEVFDEVRYTPGAASGNRLTLRLRKRA